MEARNVGTTYARPVTTPFAPTVQRGIPVTRPAAEAPAAAAPVSTAEFEAGLQTSYFTFHRLLVLLGCALSILSPANFGIAGFSLFILVPMLPTLAAVCLLLWKDRAWTYLTVTILGLLFPLMVIIMFGVLEGGFNIMERSSTWAFAFNGAAIPLILTGGIGGFRQARATRRVGVRAGWATAPGIFALIVAGIFLGTLGTSYAASVEARAATGGGYDFGPDAIVSVVTENFAFNPSDVNVASNTITEIAVVNNDGEGHTFTYTVGGSTYNHDLLGGSTTKFLVKFAEAGTIKFWCDPHSNGASDDGTGMVGNIIVS